MNREQKIDALVTLGIDQVYHMDTHQWLGVIRSLLNVLFSSMSEEELEQMYNESLEKEDDGPEKPLAG